MNFTVSIINMLSFVTENKISFLPLIMPFYTFLINAIDWLLLIIRFLQLSVYFKLRYPDCEQKNI